MATEPAGAPKTVTWTDTARFDTGEWVSLCDDPSELRLKCTQGLREARREQATQACAHYEQALAAAEVAEDDGRLDESRQIIELVMNHLQDSMASSEFEGRLRAIAAKRAAGASTTTTTTNVASSEEEETRRSLKAAATTAPAVEEEEEEDASGGASLTRTKSLQELEASEDEEIGLLVDLARDRDAPRRREDDGGGVAAPETPTPETETEKENKIPGAGRDDESEKENAPASDPAPGALSEMSSLVPAEIVLMAHACFLAGRVRERLGETTEARAFRVVGLKYARCVPGEMPKDATVPRFEIPKRKEWWDEDEERAERERGVFAKMGEEEEDEGEESDEGGGGREEGGGWEEGGGREEGGGGETRAQSRLSEHFFRSVKRSRRDSDSLECDDDDDDGEEEDGEKDGERSRKHASRKHHRRKHKKAEREKKRRKKKKSHSRR